MALTFESPIGNPELALDKTIDDGAPEPGDVITYTLIYSGTNAESQAFNVRLYDFLPAGVQFLSSDPPATSYTDGVLLFADDSVQDANEIVTVRALVLEGYERLYNHALVAADGITPTHASLLSVVTQPSMPLPKLHIVKTGYAIVLAEGEGPYTLQCQNSSMITASDVKVIDVLPTGSMLVSASPPPDLELSPMVSWSVGDLGPGDSWQATITATTPSYRGVISNTMIAVEGGGVMTQTFFASRVVTPAKILRVTKAASALEVDLGDELVYTLRYWNDGNLPADDVLLTDTLPVDVSVTEADPSVTSLTSERAVWDLGTVDAGESGRIVFTVTVGGSGGRMLHNVVDVAGPPELDSFPGHAEVFTAVRLRFAYLPLVFRDYLQELRSSPAE
jgi:uncharacterized repeat protein (TIGR01451 family)